MTYKGLSDFYRSREWALFRLGVINNRLSDDGMTICEHCGQPIVKNYDIIAHHIIELTERNVFDIEISLNPANIMLVHHVCHNKIHNKLGTIKREIYLVYGSPLSGKSSWVDSVKEPGDLIVDMDLIWMAVSGCNKYVKPDRLKNNVFAVRDLLIEQVRMGVGSWKNAYIVGGYPLQGERERVCKKLGAKEIYIECSREECLSRLAADKERNNEWKKYIEEWWSKYAPRVY